MKIFNPSGWSRTVLVGGAEYDIPAFSESREIWNSEHAISIPRIYAHWGLVALNYDDSTQKLYPTFNEYKSEQERKGLRNLLKWKKELLDYERNAKSAADGDPKFVSERKTFNVDKFEKDVELVERWLKEAGESKVIAAKEIAEVVTKRPDWTKETSKTLQ